MPNFFVSSFKDLDTINLHSTETYTSFLIRHLMFQKKNTFLRITLHFLFCYSVTISKIFFLDQKIIREKKFLLTYKFYRQFNYYYKKQFKSKLYYTNIFIRKKKNTKQRIIKTKFLIFYSNKTKNLYVF